MHSLLLPENKSDRLDTLIQCEEWSQLVIDNFFGNLTYTLLTIWGHQTFLATATNTL